MRASLRQSGARLMERKDREGGEVSIELQILLLLIIALDKNILVKDTSLDQCILK